MTLALLTTELRANGLRYGLYSIALTALLVVAWSIEAWVMGGAL